MDERPGPDTAERTALRVRNAFQRCFAAGDVIFSAGDPGQHLYVIQSGEVSVAQDEPASFGGPRELRRLGPGELLGELALVTGRPHGTRAACVSDVTALELDRPTLESMCLEQPEIALRILQEVAKRLGDAEDQLAGLTGDAVRTVVRVLVRRSLPSNDRGVPIGGTLKSLAADAGLSMLETHHVLRELFDRRVIDLIDERLVARDLEALSACAD